MKKRSKCAKMKRVALLLFVVVLLMIVCASCAKKPIPEVSEEDLKGRPEVEYFHYSFGGGMTMYYGHDYEAWREDDKVMVKIRPDDCPNDEAKEFEADRSVLDELKRIVVKYDLTKWDGFNKSAKDVYDGDSFYLSVQLSDGTSISASGYMMYPKNYGEAVGEIEALFTETYESRYPNKTKTLERYYQETILEKTPEAGELSISIPYISKGGAMFQRGNPTAEAGIIGHFVRDLDTDGIDELLVFYQEPVGNSEDPSLEDWHYRAEVYAIDDDLQVSLVGEEVLEEDAYWNDGSYGSIFLHYYDGKYMLGYFLQKKYTVGTEKENWFNIRLYEYQDGKLTCVADEGQVGSTDRDAWTFEELSNFVEVAETYGFPENLAYWKEHPFDPVFSTAMKDHCQTLVSISTRTNWDSDFHACLLQTPENETVGDYQVSGELRPQ